MMNDMRPLLFLALFLGGALFSLTLVPFPGELSLDSDTLGQTPSVIEITYPRENDAVPQEFEVQGDAETQWFTEGSIRITVHDSSGNLLSEGYVLPLYDRDLGARTAFAGLLSVGTYQGGAVLTIYRENNSDDPSFDASINIPIVVQEFLFEDESEEDI